MLRIPHYLDNRLTDGSKVVSLPEFFEIRVYRPGGGVWEYLQKSNSKLYYDRQSVDQSVLVSGAHLGSATRLSHSLFDYFFDSYLFVDVGRPL
jgi:hypothetical protein